MSAKGRPPLGAPPRPITLREADLTGLPDETYLSTTWRGETAAWQKCPGAFSRLPLRDDQRDALHAFWAEHPR